MPGTVEGNPVRVTYVLLAHLPPEGVDAFQRYETAVLALLSHHQGRLERRLRTADEQTEIHLVSFPSHAHFSEYRNDPRRADHSSLLAEAQARLELYEVRDV